METNSLVIVNAGGCNGGKVSRGRGGWGCRRIWQVVIDGRDVSLQSRLEFGDRTSVCRRNML